MFKRFITSMVILAILVAPSMVFAKLNHQLDAADITRAGNTVTVPLVVSNEDNLVAMDIPLGFSEGVTLKEVSFENTRVSYFDLKAALIDNANHTVVIGLLPQISAKGKPDLPAGTGTVANLVFEINDPSITEIALEAVEMEKPDHSLLFVYHSYDENGSPSIFEVSPEFGRTVLSLSGATDASLPETFALNQNYPNPFNPDTRISFDIPVTAEVNLTIYNVLGQEVVTLVDKMLEAGSHTVEWDASSYSSGVYFYRISAEKFTETKKMMLLK